jgi:hypothetical protein
MTRKIIRLKKPPRVAAMRTPVITSYVLKNSTFENHYRYTFLLGALRTNFEILKSFKKSLATDDEIIFNHLMQIIVVKDNATIKRKIIEEKSV